MSKYSDLKERVYQANIEIDRHGLVIFSFGNASEIDRAAGVYGIKPSGVAYKNLKPSDIVIVDLDGNVVEGSLVPSSDTKTHTVLYKASDEIGGIVHTHSPFATSWAQAKCDIPVFGTTHADHLSIPVPCTEVMPDEAIRNNYETETGYQITRRFKSLSYKEVQMVLVACHGPFTWGENALKAVENSVVLEELAKMALFTRQIDQTTKNIKDSLIQKHYQRKHGKESYYGQKQD